MLYFAYGSNMSIRRLKDPNRVPSARKICVVQLSQHCLLFQKKSTDGSAKCDAFYTGNDKDFIIGVLFEINESEKTNLDRAEGLGYGYEEKEVSILTDTGEKKAIIYYATAIDPSLKPYNWYKHHVLVGAKENNLPLEYIALIEEVASIHDPDKERETKELNIYR